MKKEELIPLLNEGLSVEELPTITNLKEIEVLIEKMNFNPKTKEEIMKGIKHLEKETIGHAEAFSHMIKMAAGKK